jgi:hypothetical protein
MVNLLSMRGYFPKDRVVYSSVLYRAVTARLDQRIVCGIPQQARNQLRYYKMSC